MMVTGCGHCGFSGSLEDSGQVTAHTEHDEAEPYGPIQIQRIWHLSRCPNCEQPTLSAYTWVDPIYDSADDVDLERIYPTYLDNDPLPVLVHQQYDSALRVKGIEPDFYAVGIRRMLEAVCQEQGAQGKDLFNQIEDLVSQGKLPEVFAKMANQLRTLGNWGAHVADTKVTKADVPLIQEFADSILDYLYREPAKVAAVEAAIQERINQARPGASST
jgi:hypothetical protein